LTNELRNNFQRSLGKLNDNDTKEVGFSELKKMISSHNSSDALRIYISLLSVYLKSCTSHAKEIQVLLIGYLASVFKENLMDPLDKPPNIIKTIVRVLEIIHNYLKENSIVIHKACGLALQEVYTHCMPKDDIDGIILIFIDPLISIVTSGLNKNSQIGAAICLSDFIQFLGSSYNLQQENLDLENDLSNQNGNISILTKISEKNF